MRHGHEQWVTRDYGSDGKGLALSKARFGEFMVALIKFGGDIHGIHAMSRTYPRAYVQAVISLPNGKAEEFTAETGFVLEKPPTLSVRSMNAGDPA